MRTVFGSDAHRAGVAQLAERQPSKLHVAGSSPVSRSSHPEWRNDYASAMTPIETRNPARRWSGGITVPWPTGVSPGNQRTHSW